MSESAKTSEPPGLIHEIIPVGLLQCNCSVLGDPETGDAVVVDPGDEVEKILAVIRRHSLKIRAILNTHAHIDHVGGFRKLREVTGAPILMHAEDLEMYRVLDIQAAMLGVRPPEAAEIEATLKDGQTLRWGRYEFQVMHTPGHSRGSCCLYLPAGDGRGRLPATTDPGRVIAGDTLFAGSIGRTDLWGGSFDAIISSIREKLMGLPDETAVYPGHGPATTIGRERAHNPFLAPE